MWSHIGNFHLITIIKISHQFELNYMLHGSTCAVGNSGVLMKTVQSKGLSVLFTNHKDMSYRHYNMIPILNLSSYETNDLIVMCR
jgi:hypothetical protein